MGTQTPRLGEVVSVLEKVLKLVALTASNMEEESRTAASKACKYIREHDLHIVDLNAAIALLRKRGYHVVAPGQPQSAPRATPTPTPTPTPSPAPAPTPNRPARPPWDRPGYYGGPPIDDSFLKDMLEDISEQVFKDINSQRATPPGVNVRVNHQEVSGERARKADVRAPFNFEDMKVDAARGNKWVSSRVYRIEWEMKLPCWGCKTPFVEGAAIYRHPRHESLCGHCYVNLVE